MTAWYKIRTLLKQHTSDAIAAERKRIANGLRKEAKAWGMPANQLLLDLAQDIEDGKAFPK